MKIKVEEYHDGEKAEMIRYYETVEKANIDFNYRVERMLNTELVDMWEEVSEHELLGGCMRVVHLYSQVNNNTRCSRILMKQI